MSSTLPAPLNALLDPSTYPHPVDKIELIETHISWLFLTGDYVYKIKKPLLLGFLDFSTLEKRGFYCEEEIRLNRRLAPDLYLERVGLFEKSEKLGMKPPGELIEYAVKMRQFDPANELHHLTKSGHLKSSHIDQLAIRIAEFHSEIAIATESDTFGRPTQIEHYTLENLSVVQACLEPKAAQQNCSDLLDWCNKAHKRLHQTFINRKDEGFVRECHGDLHLGNIVCINDEPVPFDCLEFNAELRWIDVMSELAFLLMDLEDHGVENYARRLLNLYLSHTGDYQGLSVLTYYKVYRALVRAKVACIRQQQTNAENAREEMSGYLKLATVYTRSRPSPMLIITFGYSGSGKSYVASGLVEACGAIQLRSDVERKRLLGFKQNRKTPEKQKVNVYSQEFNQLTYSELARLARLCLEAGYTTIVDAAFLKRDERNRFRKLASAGGWGFKILHTVADIDLLKTRIEARELQDNDPSEATVAVLEKQLEWTEKLDSDEQNHTLKIPTVDNIDFPALVRRIGFLRNEGQDAT